MKTFLRTKQENMQREFESEELGIENKENRVELITSPYLTPEKT